VNHASPDTVLVFEDDAAMCALVEDMLKPVGVAVVVAELKDAGAVLHQVDDTGAAVVVTDLRMPNFDGNAVCKAIVDGRPDVPVVVMTGFGSMETAVQALRAGAFDFVTKPVEAVPFVAAIQRALAHSKLSAEERRLPLEEVERRHILSVFDAMGGNRRRTSEVLGIDPKTLYRKLLGWGVTGAGKADGG
jgi:DNA-binding NtrC family response regulator